MGVTRLPEQCCREPLQLRSNGKLLWWLLAGQVASDIHIFLQYGECIGEQQDWKSKARAVVLT
jgi:hypothetical protein